MGARLLQPWHQMRSKSGEKRGENQVRKHESGSICTACISERSWWVRSKRVWRWRREDAPLASKSVSPQHDKLAHYINTCSCTNLGAQLLMGHFATLLIYNLNAWMKNIWKIWAKLRCKRMQQNHYKQETVHILDYQQWSGLAVINNLLSVLWSLILQHIPHKFMTRSTLLFCSVCNIHFPLFVVFDVTSKEQMWLFAVYIWPYTIHIIEMVIESKMYLLSV